MRLGILALVLIFFASGYKNVQESEVGKRSEAQAEQSVYNRRKFLFGGLMFLVGALVLIYYIVTI